MTYNEVGGGDEVACLAGNYVTDVVIYTTAANPEYAQFYP